MVCAATLTQAYRETDYRVLGETPMTLRIGEHSPALAALMARHGVAACAFITACNPRSQLLDEAENARRQQALAAELRARKLPCLAGVGEHPRGGWPDEPSFLVLGLSRQAADELGQRYQQNAVVWCAADAVPELLLHPG